MMEKISQVRGSHFILVSRNTSRKITYDHCILHQTNNQGVIEKWFKKKGDLIKKDETICDIDTEASAAMHKSLASNQN
jgi:16S rRNA C967 or C1407 C5-methylase (RsmB/RsmF family)